MDPKHLPRAKVAAGSAAGAIGVLVVIVFQYVTGEDIDAITAGLTVTAISSIAAYLMPEVPPWKRNEDR